MVAHQVLLWPLQDPKRASSELTVAFAGRHAMNL